MQTEFEATFSGIDKDIMRVKLKEVGAVMAYPEFLMKRVVFVPPHGNGQQWLRVRQEADKATMSLKEITGAGITDQKEIELIIDDYKKGIDFLIGIGLEQKSYQETKRELWKISGVDITLDTWPGLKPIVEIEGENEEIVKEVSELLGFDYSEAIFGAIDKVYLKELGMPMDVINDHNPLITFDNPPTA